MSAERAILLLPYGHDPLAALAAHVLAHHRDELPDLTRHTVLLPSAAGVVGLQRAMLAHTTALLPPTIAPLDAWLTSHLPTPGQLSANEREFIFFDALRHFPDLTARYGGWALTNALLTLFDELTLNHCAVPESIDAFHEALERGYGVVHRQRPAPLSDEARVVHSLFRAWHELLKTKKLVDPANARLAAMHAAITETPSNVNLYVAGLVQWSHATRDWLEQMPCSVSLMVQGEPGVGGYHPDAPIQTLIATLDWPVIHLGDVMPRTSVFRSAYALGGPPLAERAAQMRTRMPNNPLIDRLTMHEALDMEQEAHAVELQIRRWWFDDLRRCAVISNDRKLLRRIRALLERARLPVSDRSGWPLSTTSAASALNQWLTCVTYDFPHSDLLDLLRSPFMFPDMPADVRQSTVAVLESALATTRTGAGLTPLEFALDRGKDRLEEAFGSVAVSTANNIVRRLDATAAPLRRIAVASSMSFARAGQMIVQNLEALGTLPSLVDDDAGAQLLAVLDEIIESAAATDAHGNWTEFEQWFHRTLERRHFRPSSAGEGIELLSLHDAALLDCDALVLAGCTEDHLPGAIDASPFFNDAVRRELGLSTSHDARSLVFHTFRRLLEAGEHVLITWRRQDAGRPLVVAPWVERFAAFCKLAYGTPCTDPALAAWLADPRTLLAEHDAALPCVAETPAPSMPGDLLPSRLTASSYQALIDCPYQFFARAVLGLEPPRLLDEELTPADFGQLVHRCLQAFHEGVDGLPGPWRGPIDETSLPQAMAMLEEIAINVFAPHLRRTMTTRAWLQRWRRLAASYLDWQQQRAKTWSDISCELQREQLLSVEDRQVRLAGRIDRIDHAGTAEAIIDYKTGKIPHSEEIERGEHVQLAFYGLLSPQAIEAMLLGLTDDGIDDRIKFSKTALRDMVQMHRERLVALFAALMHGAPLPAHGDPDTCERCPVETLCRRQLWRGHTADADLGHGSKHER